MSREQTIITDESTRNPQDPSNIEWTRLDSKDGIVPSSMATMALSCVSVSPWSTCKKDASSFRNAVALLSL
jgi:hypothetical protein